MTRINLVDPSELHQGIDKSMFWDYKPTQEALELNRKRIADRMPEGN